MQTKRMSFVESETNAVVGLVISWAFTYWGLPLFGLEPSPYEATQITAVYFVLSVVRSYILRRIFNRITTRSSW